MDTQPYENGCSTFHLRRRQLNVDKCMNSGKFGLTITDKCMPSVTTVSGGMRVQGQRIEYDIVLKLYH